MDHCATAFVDSFTSKPEEVDAPPSGVLKTREEVARVCGVNQVPNTSFLVEFVGETFGELVVAVTLRRP